MNTRTSNIALRRLPTTASSGFRRYATPSPTAPAASATVSPHHLNWNEYLGKRRALKWCERIASVPTTGAGLTIGISYFATNEVDPTVPIFGIEPVYVYAAATFASAIGGYLVGPWLGLSAWRIWNRKMSQELLVKEKVFYQRIAKYRPDPAIQSLNAAAHPIRDYYGEKIFSLSDYRKWLRTQAKYKKLGQPKVDA